MGVLVQHRFSLIYFICIINNNNNAYQITSLYIISYIVSAAAEESHTSQTPVLRNSSASSTRIASFTAPNDANSSAKAAIVEPLQISSTVTTIIMYV